MKKCTNRRLIPFIGPDGVGKTTLIEATCSAAGKASYYRFKKMFRKSLLYKAVLPVMRLRTKKAMGFTPQKNQIDDYCGGAVLGIALLRYPLLWLQTRLKGYLLSNRYYFDFLLKNSRFEGHESELIARNGFREPFKFFTAPTAERIAQTYRPTDGKQRQSVSRTKNIVVFLQNRDFFGAQICHIPFLEALRKVYPGRKIHLVSKHKISYLFKELGLADEVILESGKVELALRYFALAPEITLNLRRQSGFVNTLVGLGSVQTKIGFTSPISRKLFTRTRTYETGVYRAQNYLRLLDREMEETHFSEGNEILIMPGAGGEHKIWPLANYLDVARVLSARHPVLKIGFVLGAKEKGMREAIAQSGFAVYDNLDIRALVEIVKRAKCVIANDCGPSHIAQIYKKRSVILYSDETYSARRTIDEWFHKHDRAVALIGEAGAPIDMIPVTEVVANVEQLLCC